mgnify:CR=1 FL=1
MKLELVEETDDQLSLTHVRGNRLAFLYRVRGGDSDELMELFLALSGAEWVVQAKANKTDDDPTAVFEVIESIDEENSIGKWLFVAEDTEDMAAGGTHYFDALVVSGPIAPKTFFAGSQIYVEQDVSRETGS